MINVILKDASFQYDVHSLIKAFYPSEEVHIENDIETGEVFSGFKVFYAGDNLECSVVKNDEEILKKSGSIVGLDRAGVKNVLKQTLYRLLKTHTGNDLVWGTLTGIRPTKIPMKLLNEGASDEEIRDFMKDTYYTSDGKITLATDIAKRERAIIGSTHGIDGYSLYIGIPFCPTTCLYCSFTSYPLTRFKNKVDEYLDALEKELDAVSVLMEGKTLDTVYIGGGTPTTLEPRQLMRLYGILSRDFDMSNVMEFTVEAGRPDSITREKLAALNEMNVTRISINPQTMNDATLRIIGRNHTVKMVEDAYYMAREAGLHNINMDIILGLPGEDEAMVAHTLSEIERLAPDSLTVHSMAIKRAAGMHQYLLEHEEIKSVNTPALMEMAIKSATSQGLLPYYLYRQKNMAGNLENVGFARDGMFGLYNILIMEEVHSIVACGAGTVTKRVFDGDDLGLIERCDNVKDVELYITKIDEMIQRKKELFKQNRPV